MRRLRGLPPQEPSELCPPFPHDEVAVCVGWHAVLLHDDMEGGPGGPVFEKVGLGPKIENRPMKKCFFCARRVAADFVTVRA